MRAILSCVVFLLLNVLLNVGRLPAAPQSGISTGEIRGKVTDPEGGAIAYATVQVTSASTRHTITSATDDAGAYRAILLRPDVYILSVQHKGLESIARTVELTVGQTLVADFEMRLPALATTIAVVDRPLLADPDRSQQSNTIPGLTIQQLPIDKRDYLTYSLLAPGTAAATSLTDAQDFRPAQAAQSGLSFFGNNGRGNAVSVDGGEANDSGGGVRPTLSQEAVQEFQVNRSNYSVELGAATGGTIDIVSRSGTHALHASAFGFFRDGVFDAADPFATTWLDGHSARATPPSNRQQFGATAGGPFVQDRTFFFAAFEHLRRHEFNAISVLTDDSIFEPSTAQETLLRSLPDAKAAALRPLLTSGSQTRSLFLANSGVFPYRTADTKASVRFDHLRESGSQFMLRYNTAVIHESNPNGRALLGASRGMTTGRLDHTAVVGWTKAWGANAVNQFRYQYNYGNFLVNSQEPFGPEININGFGYFNRDAFLPSRQFWRRQQLQELVLWNHGSHLFKAGGELRIRSNTAEAQLLFAGRFNFGEVPGSIVDLDLASTSLTAVQAFNLGLPQTFQQGFGDPRVASTEPYVAAFLEDRWRVLPGLSFELGVRYEWDDLREPLPTDRNNLAPRFAFAWDALGDHTTTVRGGIGIFYAPSNYAIAHVTQALGETDGKRQIAQVLTTIGTPGIQSAPHIYRSLLAQGVIAIPQPNRPILESDLAQFGIAPSLEDRSFLSVRFSTTPDFASAYTQQASLGIQHAFGSGLVINTGYVFVSGLRIARSRDRNLLPALVDPRLGVPVWSLTRRDPQLFRDISLLQDNVYESTGRSLYHGLTVEGEKAMTRHIRLTANYTLSKAMDDVVDFNSDYQASNQTDLRAERALSSFDQRHKVVVYSSVAAYGGVTLTPVFRANSGRPFNLLVGTDLNEDFHATTDRPPFSGRNTGRGPAFWSVDLRATHRTPLGESAQLELLAEAFNVFNHLNFKSVNNTVGLMSPPFDVSGRRDRSPSEPLAFTSAFDPRQVQLGLRLSF